MYQGIINVYKEAGFTSHDVVAKLRGISKQKKIGHTGTLDPDAVGVLPVCLGNATKVCDLLTDRRKEYIAHFRLGLTTDTQDISGTVLEEKEVFASREEVLEAILSFKGELMQIPPMYSALKVNGKKLYELAREGKEVERKARPVTIYEIEVLKENHPEYEIRVRCSKGTYIRTLCHDIGQKLGCGGVMTHLIRTQVGEFKIEETYTLTQLQQLSYEDRLEEAVVPVEKLFEALPAVTVKPEGIKPLQNGNQLKPEEVIGVQEESYREAAQEIKDHNQWMDAEVKTNGMAQPDSRKQTNGMVQINSTMQTSAKQEKVDLVNGQQYRMYNEQGVFCGIFEYDKRRRLLCPVKMFFSKND